MHHVLRRLDLNLLPVFDAVYRHRSVRLAAVELSMSTSALSHALTRLREFLKDPLFYREGHKMCPSVYAEELAPHIAQSLCALNQRLSPVKPFDPLNSSESFRIAVTDYTAFCVFPALMGEIEKMAPNIQFELCHLPNNPALNELLAGEVDLALGFSEPDDASHQDLDEVELFNDEFIVIGSSRRQSLTLDEYLAAGHLVVTPWNEKKGLLDTHLGHLGLERRIVLKTPSMLSSPHIIAKSDLLMAIPSYVAGQIAAMADVNSFKLPFYAPPFTVKIYSHKRSGKKSSTDWLKGVISRSIKDQIISESRVINA
ncbi:LysR family transcriptional regulator [Pantoea sp. Acro-805]|uniref:LysR family transcriptional regulator n=1 Tax=Candidatus Pantoea formicae TaxID=2608355 RepID=A0ABX0QTK5_9GAMM|nr:LysR family transcriptional regulator [Pantoea formicae]MDF7649673.1 LysR family transcriptional regulator [Erwiniaceae bacterium L1_54_3]NIF00388.1 LysR family transcriptional regulator [Pantoea formicae]